MTLTKICCDHCGKELDEMRDFDNTQIDMAHKWTTADLCAECLDELYALICNFCDTEKGGAEE